MESAPLPTLRSFSDIVRAERLTEPSARYSTLRLVGFLGAWPGLFFLARAAHSPIVWVVVWLLQALILEGCNIGTHESAHNNLYRRRSLNFLVGLVWSVPILYTYAAYRASHLEHHQHTHEPERDSEPPHQERNIAEYLGYMALSGVIYTGVLWFEGLEAAAGRGRAWMRAGRRRQLAALSSGITLVEFTLVGLGLALAPRVVLELWLVPYALSVVFLASMVTHPEHTGCEIGPASPFKTTRTTYSNRFIRFFIWNINLHTAHHLVPSIPGQKLPRLQRHLDEYCAYTARSYFRWHWGVAKTLVVRKQSAPAYGAASTSGPERRG